ncbi:hypothetical protein C7A12_00510 [Pseudomonas fluorescens]|nr:hypothetical protein C7A12_00510 [Pseudomonas fluorescens]PRW82444.1 hypothetical protein C7A13_00510 [Pseudomonas fluorescens]
MLAKNSQAPRSFRKHALLLTFFASKLAPTVRGCVNVRVGCFSGALLYRYSPPPTTPAASAHSRPGPGPR